ncbi:MAG: extracellular solute-binding protein [Steroidobacteraceae bacterium]|jgi:multiple sugar transport system substrate-binding protein|nr:extracellular solute-binding protein [Steroidobacteraceae bacterium]
MPETVRLRGIGWDHPRCMAPLRASIDDYRRLEPGVEVSWEARSLFEFGEGNFHELLQYDLIVFDHPYCGQVARERSMLDLAQLLTADEQAGFASDSLGPCWASYHAEGGIWGLPLDAAGQVSSYRPDLMERFGWQVPQTLDAVFELATAAHHEGLYLGWPWVPTDAICTFLTLCASAGFPVSRDRTSFPGRADAALVLDAMQRLAGAAHPASASWNPIRCYDHMSSADDVAYVPYAFGYTNYSRADRSKKLRYCDIPGLAAATPAGAVLGGAGLGISSASRHPGAALDYARFLCSTDYQAGAYVRNGGQPASRAAWTAPVNDDLTSGFFAGTRKTLEQAYLRPTFDGYIPHFREAGQRIVACLKGEAGVHDTADLLREDYFSR